MQITVAGVTFFVGVFLVVAAIFGGGFQIKEVKIPKLSIVPRVMSIVVGLALIALVIWFPHSLPSSDVSPGAGKNIPAGSAESPKIPPEASKLLVNTEPTKCPSFRGRAIENGSITVRDVKRILGHVGNYKGGIDDDCGPSYSQAVMDFQFSQKIAPDGLVGPDTYAKLREAWPEFFASK